jgi:OOP family OmpA-OmpF porin
MLGATMAAWAILSTPALAGRMAGRYDAGVYAGGYGFEGDQGLRHGYALGARLGYGYSNRIGVEGFLDLVSSKGKSPAPDRHVQILSIGGEGLYRFSPDEKFVPHLAAGARFIQAFDPGGILDGSNLGLQYGAGGTVFLRPDLNFRADIRHIFIPENGYNHIEYTVGLSYAFPAAEAPAPSAAPRQAVPAPVPPPPPTIPAAAPPPPPLPPPPPAPAPAPAPVAVSLSADPGMIPAGGCSTLRWTTAGASEVRLDPGVGPVPVAGSQAVCPPMTGTYTVTASGPGGSRSASATVTVAPAPRPRKEELRIHLRIEFETDKADVLPKYRDEIGRVADFMKKYPQVKGTIEGHTDDVGSEEYNLALSKRRADAVRRYLVERYGIAGDRLGTTGYGFSRPVAGNGTIEGRQKNRRIEANFDPVTVEVGP